MFKMRLRVLLYLFSLLTSVSFISSAFAQADVQRVCYLSDLSFIPAGSLVESFVFDPVTFEIYFERSTTAASEGANAILPIRVPITAYEVVYIDGDFFDIYAVADYILPDSDCDGSTFTDGRLNNGPTQTAAPVALYCNTAHGVEVWDVGADSVGTPSFIAAQTDIDAALGASSASGTPTLVAEGLGNSLYAAPSGTLVVLAPEVNDPGKQYRFEFSGTACD